MTLSCQAAEARPKPNPTTINPKSPPQPHNSRHGVWAERIEGRYRPIPVKQLALAWFCYKSGHISFRQFRIVMAAHEMHERRKYTKAERASSCKPSYGLDEIKCLVGGRGSVTAERALASDVRHLARIGLVTIDKHAIRFATAVDQIDIPGHAGFDAMLEQFPNLRRSVPVPRRILRALAGGFTAGMAAVTLAVLIRSVYWHKGVSAGERSNGESGGGAFRIDGRTKREWIAEVFGVTPRTVTEARARLIELGWLVPLETSQFLLNRYGAHDAINPLWDPANDQDEQGAESDLDESESSSPMTVSAGGSSRPRTNQNTSPSGNLETRRLRPRRAGPAGESTGSMIKRKEQGGGTGTKQCAPSIRDIQPEDLRDMERLLKLYDQAVGIGIAKPGEAGRMDFLALAERARMHGRRSGALLYWLLRERKFEFITHAAEDEAGRRLKEHLYTIDTQCVATALGNRDGRIDRPGPDDCEPHDDRVVEVCLRVAQQHGVDPARIAAETKGWKPETWANALARYRFNRSEQVARMYGHSEGV
jgi:hypothetical protein